MKQTEELDKLMYFILASLKLGRIMLVVLWLCHKSSIVAVELQRLLCNDALNAQSQSSSNDCLTDQPILPQVLPSSPDGKLILPPHVLTM